MRYFFRVEYNGSRYGGWQVQPNAVSIQEKLQKAFSTVLRYPCTVTGAGRTDAGVHARAQGAHIDIQKKIDVSRCELSVNSILPSDIAIYGLQAVDADFHARFSALSRRYTYYFIDRKSPLYYSRVWMLFHYIDWNLVNLNLQHLRGTHDFAAFCASNSGSDNTTCTVENTYLEKKDERMLLTLEADRFIYKMVRSIAGTLVDIGRGRISESMEEILRSKDRSRVGETAPACGLVLEWVKYDNLESDYGL